MWIDTHCHLDAAGIFEPAAVPARSHRAVQGIAMAVVACVEVANFATVRELAHALGYAYTLGIHPLYVLRATPAHLECVAQAVAEQLGDPNFVAVGEIGLDFFVPALTTPAAIATQAHFYREQLKMARHSSLPVVLHVRRSADHLLKHLRQIEVCGGVVHAFNGSLQQAQAFIDRGFKLGFGGAMTFPAASHLRELATRLPLSAIVLETDAPNMPPQWLYATAGQRAAGQVQLPNTPAQLPRIAQVLADLRGIPLAEIEAVTSDNARSALPRLVPLIDAALQRDSLTADSPAQPCGASRTAVAP